MSMFMYGSIHNYFETVNLARIIFIYKWKNLWLFITVQSAGYLLFYMGYCCTPKKGSYLLQHKSVTIWNHIDIGIYSCKLSKQFLNFIKYSKLFFAPHGI